MPRWAAEEEDAEGLREALLPAQALEQLREDAAQADAASPQHPSPPALPSNPNSPLCRSDNHQQKRIHAAPGRRLRRIESSPHHRGR
jgi:hypothetical protein